MRCEVRTTWMCVVWTLLAMGAANVSAQEVAKTAPAEGVSKSKALKIQRHIAAGRDVKAVALLEEHAQDTLWCDLAFEDAIADQLRADIGVLARRQQRRDEAWACVDYGLRRLGQVHRASALYEASKLVRTAEEAELKEAIAHAIATDQRENVNDRCLRGDGSVSRIDDTNAFVFRGGRAGPLAAVPSSDLVRFLELLHGNTIPRPVTDIVCLLRVTPMLELGSWKEQRRFVADALVAAAARHAPKPAYVEKLPNTKPPHPNAGVLDVQRLSELAAQGAKPTGRKLNGWKARFRCWTPAKPDHFPASCASPTPEPREPDIRRVSDEVEIAHVRWDIHPDPQSAGALHYDAVFIEAQGRLFKLEGGTGSSLGNYGNDDTSTLRVHPDHFVYAYTRDYHDAGSGALSTGYWLCGTAAPIRCLTWWKRAEWSAWGPYHKGWSWIPKYADAAKRRADRHSWVSGGDDADHSSYVHPAPFFTLLEGRIALGKSSEPSLKRLATGVFHLPGYEVLDGLTLEEAFDKVEQLNATSGR